jgi:hypothetical protein
VSTLAGNEHRPLRLPCTQVSVMSTCGYGPTSPLSYSEGLVMTLAIGLGVMTNLTIFGMVCGMLVEINASAIDFDKKMDAALRYVMHCRMPMVCSPA